MEERAIIYQASKPDIALRQGEILTGVTQYKPVSNEGQNFSFNSITHPYSIVVTQDCDLDWDYRARQGDKSTVTSKTLNSIILCEISSAQEIRYETDNINSKAWKLVQSHRHERYYFFEKIPPEYDAVKEGVIELTADFKKIFGIDAQTLYRQIETGTAKKRTVLASPYLEHFSARYHNFHNRIALPTQYESEPEG